MKARGNTALNRRYLRGRALRTPCQALMQRIAAHVMGTRSGSLIPTVASPGPSLDRMGRRRNAEARALPGRKLPTRATANKSYFRLFALNLSFSSTEAILGFGFPIGFQGGPGRPGSVSRWRSFRREVKTTQDHVPRACPGFRGLIHSGCYSRKFRAGFKQSAC